MNKSKILIGFVICVTIYVGIILFVFRDKFFGDNDSNPVYFVLDSSVNCLYQDGKCTEVKDFEIENLDTTFNTFVGYDEFGKYKLKLGKVWNLFDEDNNYVSHDGYLFAVSSLDKLHVETERPRTLSNEEKMMLNKEYELKDLDNLMVDQVFDVDLNEDDKMDTLISVSYHDVGDVSDSYYNLVVAIIGNKKYNIIDEKGSEIDSIYEIKVIFKNDDNKYKSFILEKITNPAGDVDDYSTEDYIYEFNNDKYKNILERE